MKKLVVTQRALGGELECGRGVVLRLHRLPRLRRRLLRPPCGVGTARGRGHRADGIERGGELG